jgi:hypothetical protein
MMSVTVTRREHVARIASLVEAGRGSKRQKKKAAKKKAEKQRMKEQQGKEDSPEKYREEHGKCPKGYNWDSGENKCVQTGGDQVQPKEEAPKDKGGYEGVIDDLLSDEEPSAPSLEDKKKPSKTPSLEGPTEKPKKQKDLKKELQRKQQEKKQKERKSPERQERIKQKQENKEWTKKVKTLQDKNVPMEEKTPILNELSKKDKKAYDKEVQRMRDEGELPDKKTAELLVQVRGMKDLLKKDPGLKNDPERVKEIIEQQKAQRDHEKRMIERQRQFLENFAEEKELAEIRGDPPPKLDPNTFALTTEALFGRDFDQATMKEAEELGGDDDDIDNWLEDTVNRRQPNRKSKFGKWLEKLFKPLPEFEDQRSARSSWEDRKMTPGKMQTVLDAVAEELDRRKAPLLASVVDAEASDLPEADKMPEPPKLKPNDNDNRLGTSDMGEDLGMPPYDKVRPKVKGDEPAGASVVKAGKAPSWVMREIKRTRNKGVVSEKNDIIVKFGNDENAANSFEDRINAEANRHRGLDDDVDFIEAYGEQNPKTGEYQIRIMM